MSVSRKGTDLRDLLLKKKWGVKVQLLRGRQRKSKQLQEPRAPLDE
jgi:hypothetical protein